MAWQQFGKMFQRIDFSTGEITSTMSKGDFDKFISQPNRKLQELEEELALKDKAIQVLVEGIREFTSTTLKSGKIDWQPPKQRKTKEGVAIWGELFRRRGFAIPKRYITTFPEISTNSYILRMASFA